MIAGLKLIGKSLIGLLIWLWLNTVIRGWQWLDITLLNIDWNRYNFTVTLYMHGETYSIQKQFRHSQLISFFWTTHARKCDYRFEVFFYRYWTGWLPIEFHASFDKTWRCQECGYVRDFPMPAHRTCQRCLDKLAAQAAEELKANEEAQAKGEAAPEYVEEVW